MSDAEDADTIADTIAANAAKPAKVTGDAGSVELPKISDLIAAEKYLRAKSATSSPRGGLRFVKLLPPGAV